MKKFTVNCDFGGQSSPFSIYIGEPEDSHNPLYFQSQWLANKHGGAIPPDVMEAIAKLQSIAQQNQVSLEELCVYALGSVEEEARFETEIEQDIKPSEGSDYVSSSRLDETEANSELSGSLISSKDISESEEPQNFKANTEEEQYSEADKSRAESQTRQDTPSTETKDA